MHTAHPMPIHLRNCRELAATTRSCDRVALDVYGCPTLHYDNFTSVGGAGRDGKRVIEGVSRMTLKNPACRTSVGANGVKRFSQAHPRFATVPISECVNMRTLDVDERYVLIQESNDFGGTVLI